MKSTLIVSFLSLSCFAYAQKVIISTPGNIAASGAITYLKVETKAIDCNDVTLQTDKGQIYKTGCSYAFYTEYAGPANITAYTTINGKSIAIGKQIINVAFFNRPLFKIGSGQSRLPVSVFKHAEKARVEANVDDVASPEFKLIEFTLTVLHRSTGTFTGVKNIGAVFSPELKALMESVRPDDGITFERITATDPNGEKLFIADREMGVY